MRKIISTFTVFALALGIISCQHDVETDVKVTEYGSPTTRGISIPISESGWFDWENVNKIEVRNGEPLALPWIAGSNTTLPEDFLNDYYQEDGWTLIYNDFMDLEDNNMFMLYNVPRGLLRIFYYSRGVIDYGDNLFFALGLSQNSLTLINNNIPWSSSATTDGIYTPDKNYVIAPAIYQKSLNGFGPDRWSVAEFDLSYYYNYPSNTYANLILYSTQISNLNATGFINGQIEGTMVSEAQYSTPGSKFNVGQTALDFGKVVTDKKFLDTFFKKDDSSENKTRVIAALPAIEMGAKALSAIIGGIMSKPQPQLEGFVSNFSSKLSAEISLSGTITRQFNPVSKYFNIPGASAPLDGQYPDMETKFGVWYLEKVPEVYYNENRYTYVYTVNKTRYTQLYTDTRIWTKELINVKLNPEIEKEYEITDLSCGLFFDVTSNIYEWSLPLQVY
ncbi:MAG: hypothetical protein LIO85_01050, partial [Rikenellaceae bacterium]|nr:hypothetical protein [Rikenellaceae bacterium]